MLSNKTRKAVGGGFFSKTAIVQGLAGHWSTGGEQWFLHHSLRLVLFCFSLTHEISLFCPSTSLPYPTAGQGCVCERGAV